MIHKGKIKLNLGCGKKYIDGYINCDFVSSVKAEKHFNLNNIPYPFPDNFADEILLDNVLEHLIDVTTVMEEMYRLLKKNGVLKIFVPYFKSDGAFNDPTHLHYFSERSMDYYSTDFEYNYYSKARYKIVQANLFCANKSLKSKIRTFIPFKNILKFFFFNMYDGLYFELKAIK